ncbi:MAG: hypothetical protein ACRD3T_00810 [Terriglobia bacterium]
MALRGSKAILGSFLPATYHAEGRVTSVLNSSRTTKLTDYLDGGSEVCLSYCH